MNKMRAVVKDDPMLSFKTPDPIKPIYQYLMVTKTRHKLG
uniref:Uncharacterized protein n=1 Tax=Anopheles arabiensis TaxID=7173 RepID=A0A182IG52_ANOAR